MGALQGYLISSVFAYHSMFFFPHQTASWLKEWLLSSIFKSLVPNTQQILHQLLLNERKDIFHLKKMNDLNTGCGGLK
jgi:hypothetical protein